MLYIGNIEPSLQQGLWFIWKHSLGSDENRYQLPVLIAQGSARVIWNTSVHLGFDGFGEV